MAHILLTEKQTIVKGLIDLVTGSYPGFLFGLPLNKVLPIFHFHEVTAAYLEPFLIYLAENGYRTVTSDAISGLVRRGVHPGPRTVALCFDDAWASLWTVATPLLKKYSFTAIAYAVPGWIGDSEGATSTIARPSDGIRDRLNTPFVTWSELRSMQNSGTIDVQAHTCSHGMIFCSDKITGFVTPEYNPDPFMSPLLKCGLEPRAVTSHDLGYPLYPTRSRMSDAIRYVGAAGAREKCFEHVWKNGGKEFFRHPEWRTDLLKIAAKYQGRFETLEEQRKQILEELLNARNQLNHRLGVTTVRHMCFPWMVCGKLAESLLTNAGYETALAERLFGRRAVSAKDNPYRLMRLKHQFIYCLPGNNRKLFLNVGLKSRWSNWS